MRSTYSNYRIASSRACILYIGLAASPRMLFLSAAAVNSREPYSRMTYTKWTLKLIFKGQCHVVHFDFIWCASSANVKIDTKIKFVCFKEPEIYGHFLFCTTTKLRKKNFGVKSATQNFSVYGPISICPICFHDSARRPEQKRCLPSPSCHVIYRSLNLEVNCLIEVGLR